MREVLDSPDPRLVAEKLWRWFPSCEIAQKA